MIDLTSFANFRFTKVFNGHSESVNDYSEIRLPISLYLGMVQAIQKRQEFIQMYNLRLGKEMVRLFIKTLQGNGNGHLPRPSPS